MRLGFGKIEGWIFEVLGGDVVEVFVGYSRIIVRYRIVGRDLFVVIRLFVF